MIDRPSEVGRGGSPADPSAFLRRLLGRDPTARQQARVVEVQRRLDLRPGDSIFVIVAILETYLQQIEVACLEVRRSNRKTLRTACITAVASAALMVLPLYFLNAEVRSTLGWRSMPATDGDREGTLLPLRAFLDAILHQMPDGDVSRIAESNDAMTILQALPRATDDQLAKVSQYLSQPLVTKPR